MSAVNKLTIHDYFIHKENCAANAMIEFVIF